MSIRSVPKHKISRKLGVNIWGDPKSPLNTRFTRPGQHGKNKRRKVSSYGFHLNEKQKIKGFYGMKEKQFMTLFKKAYKKDNVADHFLASLESRLDAIIFRSKIASTIFASKQLISHKHVLVNDKVVNISSYSVKPGDIITIKEGMKSNAIVSDSLNRAHKVIPSYYEISDNSLTVKFLKNPAIEEIVYPFTLNPSLIVEFYARKM